jgi:hypothetical protein
MGHKQEHLLPREGVTSPPRRERSMMGVGGKPERDNVLIYGDQVLRRADAVVWERRNLLNQRNMEWQIAATGRQRAHTFWWFGEDQVAPPKRCRLCDGIKSDRSTGG